MLFFSLDICHLFQSFLFLFTDRWENSCYPGYGRQNLGFWERLWVLRSCISRTAKDMSVSSSVCCIWQHWGDVSLSRKTFRWMIVLCWFYFVFVFLARTWKSSWQCGETCILVNRTAWGKYMNVCSRNQNLWLKRPNVLRVHWHFLFLPDQKNSSGVTVKQAVNHKHVASDFVLRVAIWNPVYT